MKDNAFDFLIYGLVAVFSILGMINKARKDKASSRQPEAGEYTDDDIDAVDDLPHYPVPRPKAVRRFDIPQPNASSSRNNAKGESSDATIREMIVKEGGRSTTATKKVGNADNKIDTEETIAHSGGSALAEFDLRKAVIYSEILKPKYDEY